MFVVLKFLVELFVSKVALRAARFTERHRKTKIGTEVAHVTQTPLSRSKPLYWRPCWRIRQRWVGVGTCWPWESAAMLPSVRPHEALRCPRGRRGADHIVAAAHLQLVTLGLRLQIPWQSFALAECYCFSYHCFLLCHFVAADSSTNTPVWSLNQITSCNFWFTAYSHGMIFTLRTKLSGQCIVISPVCGCGSVTTIIRNCVHRSSPNWVCR